MPSAVFYESKKHSGLELFRQLPARTTTSTRMKSCISKYAAVDYAHVKVERECIRHVEKLGINKPLGERLLRDQIMQGLYDKDTANMCLTWGVGERGGSNIKSSGPETSGRRRTWVRRAGVGERLDPGTILASPDEGGPRSRASTPRPSRPRG